MGPMQKGLALHVPRFTQRLPVRQRMLTWALGALCAATVAAAPDDAFYVMHVAHLASQDVVADKWAAGAPEVSSLACAEPSRVGHVTKNADIWQTPFLFPPSDLMQKSTSLGMPIYAGCQVYVSDEWRFIYVRNPKSSSTALLKAITEQLCGGQCTEEQLRLREMMQVLAPKWEAYFVFTVVRNPWTRALSAYTMFNSHFLFREPASEEVSPTEHCGVPFEAFSWDAYQLRHVCEAESCCAYVGGKRTPGFVDIHITDQAHCAFLPSGEPFVDYIGASENLDASWRDIVAAVNERAGTAFEARDPENPNGNGGEQSGGVAHTCTSEKVLQHYGADEVYGVAMRYAMDVVRFGYM
eukprot:jgi/Ulvmu1/9760/UM055_0100.1